MKNCQKIIALILAVLCVSLSSGCLKYTSNILDVTTAPASSDTYTTAYQPTTSYPYVTEPSTLYPEISTLPEETTGSVIPTTLPVGSEPSTSAVVPSTEIPTSGVPVTEAPTTQAAEKDPSQWSKAETLKFLTDAMNKSRAVTTPLTVHHSEAFSFTVSDMNDTVAGIVNKVIASVAKPSDETLQYNGGKATNSDGEVVPLLLPKKGNFFLDEAGCTSVSASKSGSDIIIKVTLVEEKVNMTTPPKYNSTACGYLDVASLDLPSIVKISSFDIDYQGTTITYTINADGYCSKAAYHVLLGLDIAGSGMGIKANIKIGGYEDEVWEVNW